MAAEGGASGADAAVGGCEAARAAGGAAAAGRGGRGGAAGGRAGGAAAPAAPPAAREEVHNLTQVVPLCIIGCELEALALCCRLPRALLPHVAVVDPSGRWCARWRRRHAALAADFVRSPVTQSPHIDPQAMARFAGLSDNGVIDRRKGAEAHQRLEELATSAKDYVQLPGARLFADFCAHMASDLGLRGRVLKDGVAALLPLEDDERERLQLAEGGLRVVLASGSSLVARAVVYALRPAAPNVPAFVGRCEAASTPYKIPRDAMLRAEQVDLRGMELAEQERVLVVGGGMSSAHLACGAVAAGAGEVTLACHRRLKRREFEVEPRWMGNRELYNFRSIESAAERARRVAEARGGATVNRHTWRRMQEHIREGALIVRQETAVADARWDGAQWRVSFADDPLDAPEEIFDRIWLATGERADARCDRLLADFMAHVPCELAAGLPMLEPDCSWPDAPLFVMGPLAALAVGPAAGLLPGIRAAADNVVRGLQQPLPILDVEDFAAGASAAAAQEARMPPPEAFQAHFLGSGVQREATRKERVAADQAPLDGLTGTSELLASLGHEAVAMPRREVQTYVMAQCEHDWEHGPPRPEHFWLDVTVTLGEPVQHEDVRCHFGERSLEMWAKGADAVWHLHIPRLYKKVLPERNCFKVVKGKANKVVISLHKFDDSEWQFLKG